MNVRITTCAVTALSLICALAVSAPPDQPAKPAQTATLAKARMRTTTVEAKVIERQPDPQNPGKDIVTASGGVTLTSEEMTVKAQEMVASASKEGFEQVRLTGSPVVIKGSRKTKEGIEQRLDATSDEALYFVNERRLILSGSVKGTLVEVERERTWDLTSQRAQFWLDEDRFRLESVVLKITMPEKTGTKTSK
jgi:lipopolysaccharide export system protein LptA